MWKERVDASNRTANIDLYDLLVFGDLLGLSVHPFSNFPLLPISFSLTSPPVCSFSVRPSVRPFARLIIITPPLLPRSSRQDLFQSLNDLISHLLCPHLTTQILSPKVLIQDILYGLLDMFSRLRLTQRVSQHHCGRKDSSDRVRNVLTGDIGGTTVDWLVETHGGG